MMNMGKILSFARFQKTVLFGLLIGIAQTSPSYASEDCLGSLKPRLPVLEMNSAVVVREGEKQIFGNILAKGENFPHLADGSHVFILEQGGTLAYSERYPDFDPVSPVVTHRSLYHKMSESLGYEPKLIALGEIHVNHGLITSVNNKAGTAFLPNEYLPEMVEVLRERGLPILPETQVIPFQNVKSGHDSEIDAALYRNQIENDPQMKELYQKMMDFRAKTFKRFPSSEGPGLVDWKAFLLSTAGPEDHYSLLNVSENERIFYVAFGWMEHMNDRYRVIPRIAKMLSVSKLEEIINHLDRYEGSFPK